MHAHFHRSIDVRIVIMNGEYIVNECVFSGTRGIHVMLCNTRYVQPCP